MRSFVAVTLALALAAVQPVLSVPAITSPVSSTIGSGGKLLTVAWNDNGNAPKVQTWKGINIFLATGDVNTQYKLQELATNISVSKTSGKYVVDSNIGPDGGFYFIRMESVYTNTTGIPDMAFSSKFTLKNMTGTFNSTVQAAASSNAVGSSSSSSSTAGSSKPSSSSITFSVASTSASSPSSSNTQGSAAASSGASSLVNVQQSLVLLGTASAAVAGLVAML